MANRYTVTPWRSQRDLLEVRKQIYQLKPNQPDRRRYAVDRIMAWKLRGNLPHAVESTALLVDAVLHHDLTVNSTFSVRAAYSAAFTRFVTGFCDIGRQKERTLEPSSMLDIAKQIGMPVELVGLRHEATHEELPGIQRLAAATAQALRWLWDVYWSRLEEPETAEAIAASLARLKTDVRPILRGFRSSRRDAIRAANSRSPEQQHLTSETSQSCMDMTKNNIRKVEVLVDVLIDDNLLIPSKRELGSSLEGAYLIWDRLLFEISSSVPEFLPILLNRLLDAMGKGFRVGSETDPAKEALCAWVMHIVDTPSWRPPGRAPVQGWISTTIMTWCCVNPGHWSRHLGNHVIETAGAEFGDAWRDIFESTLLKDEPVQQGEHGAPETSDAILTERAPTNGDSQHYTANEPGGEHSEMNTWERAALAIKSPIGVIG